MSKGIQNYPNATTERDNAYRRIDAMEQQIDGYRVTCDALRAQLAASEKLVEDMREKPEPLTTNDWRLLYLGHEAALLDLRAQLAAAEKERDAATEETRLAFVGHLDARAEMRDIKAQRDSARGEAAGYREALAGLLPLFEKCYPAVSQLVQSGLATSTPDVPKFENFIFVRKSRAALATPGKSISEWQAEALEEFVQKILKRSDDADNRAAPPTSVFIDAIRAEAARLRAGGGE